MASRTDPFSCGAVATTEHSESEFTGPFGRIQDYLLHFKLNLLDLRSEAYPEGSDQPMA